MTRLQAEYQGCTSCYLHQGRKMVVPGNGNLDAHLLIIGEGPGSQEDKQGKPFVGPSGICLEAALTEAGASREDVWITNRVLCIPKGSSGGVVAPAEGPLQACHLRLLSEVYIVDPRVILCLGKTAADALVGTTNMKMGTLAGKMFRLEFEGNMARVSYPAIATWHPAYLLRNRALRIEGDKVHVEGAEATAWVQHVRQAVELSRIPRSYE